jgi:ABC-2 type transport system permease protein
VLGKFFAQLMVFGVPVLVACILPLTLMPFGKVSLLACYSTVLTYLLLGAACIAIGTLISSLTENQIIAYLATFGVLLVCYLMQGIKSLFTSGNTLALIVFSVLLAIAAVLIGLSCKSLTAGCGVFCGGAVVLVILFKMRAAWLLTAFNKVLSALALFKPFQDSVSSTVSGYSYNGYTYTSANVFDVTGLIYYVTVIVLFLFLTGQALEKRRWN